MKKILLLRTFLFTSIFANELQLTKGWNLVGINAQLTLTELENQIGIDNLLIIQGPKKVYKKVYVDANLDLNDFTELEEDTGYWLTSLYFLSLDEMSILMTQKVGIMKTIKTFIYLEEKITLTI